MNSLEISALQVGEKIGVTNRYGSGVALLTVARRTATQLVLSDNSRWNLNGKELGQGETWHRRHLISAAQAEANAEAHRAEVERTIAINKVTTANFRALSMEQLARISAIIEEGK